MFHSNKKLLFLLLLLNGTSSTIDKHDDEPSEQDSPHHEPILGTFEDAFTAALSLGVFKTFEDSLATEKLGAAEFLELYIKENLKFSEFTGKTIAQCIVSPLTKHQKSKNEKDNNSSDSYEYQLIYPGSLLHSCAYSIPAAALREVMLNRLTKILHTSAKKFKVKHPPEIKKNKKFYLIGKLIINSVARHMLDECLHYFWKKTSLGKKWGQT